MNSRYAEIDPTLILDYLPVGILFYNENGKVRFLSRNIDAFIPTGAVTLTIDSHISIFADVYNLNSQIAGLADGLPFEKELYAQKTSTNKEKRAVVKGIPVNWIDGESGGLLIFEDIKLENTPEKKKGADPTDLGEILIEAGLRFFLADESGSILYSSGADKYIREGKINLPFDRGLKRKEIIRLPEENATIKFIAVKAIPGTTLGVIERDMEEEAKTDFAGMTALKAGPSVVINNKGIVVFAEDADYGIFDPDSLTGEKITKAIPSFTDEYLAELLLDLENSNYKQTEFTFFGKNNNISYFHTTIFRISKEYVSIVLTDITDRSVEEKKLRDSENFFREAVASLPFCFCAIDANNRITRVNPAFRKRLAYSEKELAGKDFYELIDAENAAKAFNPAEACGSDTPLPVSLKTGSGESVEFSLFCSRIKNQKNELQYYFFYLSEEADREDPLIKKLVFDASERPMVFHTANRIIAFNDKFFELSGFKDESFLRRKNFLSLFGKNEKVNYQKASFKERITFPAELNVQGAEPVKLTADVKRIRQGPDIFFLSSFSESAQKKTDLNELSEMMKLGIWRAEAGADGKLEAVYYSPYFKELTGYEASVFLKDGFLWKSIVHPEDAAEYIASLKYFYKNQEAGHMKFVYRIYHKNGKVVWIENSISVERDSSGNVIKATGKAVDISDYKKTEEDLIKANNALKESNETKDRFLSVISHDLRNPFSSILGFTEMLLQTSDLSKKKRDEYVSFIQSSSQNMLNLLNSLLDWTRLQTGRIKFEPKRVNAGEILFNAISMLSGNSLKKNIELVKEAGDELYVHGDQSLLTQALNNLVSNAIKFTPKGGRIKISAKLKPGGRDVLFSVEDNGVGIDKDDIDKLFIIDKKFTTNGTDGERGSGLGLSLVYEIVKKHGGNIDVISKKGEGTKFVFNIPTSSDIILLTGKTQTDILLYTKLIKNLTPGHRIISVRNGDEAWKSIRNDYPALVITEHELEGRSGLKLAIDLKRSDIKNKPPVIVLASGLSAENEEKYKNTGVEYIFKKPVNLGVLKNALEKTLKQPVT